MKNYLFILFLCVLSAQNTRFIDEVFDSVTVTENVVYGNAPDLPFIFLFEWNTYDIDLHMDVYEPVGDNMEDRPVIIFAHSGAFFIGSKEAQDMVALCEAAAKRGYVAVSMEYRLGLNILSTYSGERAVYRGVQDASAVIRFLREFHSDFNIDYDKIFFWGSSAGSFIGLHLSYIEESERPLSTYGNQFDPDLGCFDCEGNDYVHSSKPEALISTWGAIADLEYIDEYENVPTALFHGTLDLIVPYDEGFPFTLNITLPYVYGSLNISDRMTELGINHSLNVEENEPHEYYGSLNGNFDLGGGPNEYWNSILDTSYNFLYQYLDQLGDGDINDDDILNIQDIIVLINFILDIQEPTADEFQSGDMNGDSILNILDVILMIEQIVR